MRFLLLLLSPALLFGQALFSPDLNRQFTDSSGHPLTGGKVYQCQAGQACPGTVLATYTTSSGSVQNQNPITLDAAGRTLGIYLTAGAAYRFVVTNSLGVIIPNAGGDNIIGTSGSSSGGGNFWSLSGSAIVNTNGSGTGAVNVGGAFTAAGTIQSGGALSIGNGSGKFAVINANSAMTANISTVWPRVNAVGVLTNDGSGNLVWAAGGGGGSGCTPAGADGNIQFKAGSACAGSANLTWSNVNQQIVVTGVDGTAGIATTNGSYFQSDGAHGGFLAAAATGYNAVQVPLGGVTGRNLTATAYTEIGANSGAPTATGAEPGFPHAGTVYCDTGSSPCVPKLHNGIAWVTLATGGATSPGGADTNVQLNIAGAFAASSALRFGCGSTSPAGCAANQLQVFASDSAHAGVAVITGFMQSDQGFVATPSTAVGYNVIQAPGGGMAAKSFTATNYVEVGFSNGPPTGTAFESTFPNKGALYCDTNPLPTACAMKYWNGSAWTTIATGSGGPGSPGAPNGSVQYNCSGSFCGNVGFTYNGTLVQIATGGAGAVAGLSVVTGFIQADAGFLANGTTNFNAVQAPAGGMSAKSFSATNYIKMGHFSGAPTLTAGDSLVQGTMYFDDIAGAPRVWNGGAYVALGGGGGVSSINSLAGALTLTGTANEISVSSVGTTLTLSTPQQIGTASAVNFGSVTTTGGFNANVSGSSPAFFTASSSFIVNGDGTTSIANALLLNGSGSVNVTANTVSNSIQTRGGINTCSAGTCSGGSALSVNGSTLIGSNGHFPTGFVSDGGVQATGYNVAGGFIGQNWDINFPGGFTISGVGTFSNLRFRGGVLVTAFSILGDARTAFFMWLFGVGYWIFSRRRRHASNIYGE